MGFEERRPKAPQASEDIGPDNAATKHWASYDVLSSLP